MRPRLLCSIPLVLLSCLVWGSALAAERPNILLVISDDQSYPHASAYGCRGIDTPGFDRVAQLGVLFRNAFAASPGCSPSRAALLTGRQHWQLEHAGTHASYFSPKFVTYPDLLENAGYHVGYTGKGWGPGDWKTSGRLRNPAGPAYQERRRKPPRQGISATDYAGNFEQFLEERPDDKPFCFWLGGSEPHRKFAPGAGLEVGKRIEDVEVPTFLPDTREIRSDILDYFVEIEWFDAHLTRALELLETQGELESTLVIVTSDNGMAFPRAKANVYEYGIHVPLAICWPQRVPGGRVVDDLVGFIDLTATILDVAGVRHPSRVLHENAPTGTSLGPVLLAEKSGLVDPSRRAVYSGRERHSSSRYRSLAYPQRALRTTRHLYIRNFRPERWPAGAPQKYHAEGRLGPMHDAYHDIDACPTLSLLVSRREEPQVSRYFHLAVDRRPAEELYDIVEDPGCLVNLATTAGQRETLDGLRQRLEAYLRTTKDPRIVDGGDVFETYERVSAMRRFPAPKGESSSQVIR